MSRRKMEKSLSISSSRSNYEEWKECSVFIETPCCNEKEKIIVKLPFPMQIYLIAYQKLNVIKNGIWKLPFKGKASSSHPCHFCDGSFTIPECGDGLYQINVAIRGNTDSTLFSLIVTDSTGLNDNAIVTLFLDDNTKRGTISIIYPLRERYVVSVTGSGSVEIIGGVETYLNLARVA